MCAGVQNVSRPIDMCQEMSQIPPTIPDAIPATMHQIVHGMDVASALAAARSPIPAPSCVPSGMLCPILCFSAQLSSAVFSLRLLSLVPLTVAHVRRSFFTLPLVCCVYRSFPVLQFRCAPVYTLPFPLHLYRNPTPNCQSPTRARLVSSGSSA